MLELWPYVESFEQALRPVCSLQQLAYQPAKLRQLLQLALTSDDLQSVQWLAAAPAALQVGHG